MGKNFPLAKLVMSVATLVLVGGLGLLWLESSSSPEPTNRYGGSNAAAETDRKFRLWCDLAAVSGSASALLWLLWQANRARRADDAGLVQAAKYLAKHLQHSAALSDDKQASRELLDCAINTACVELAEYRRKEKLIIDRAVDVICVIDTDSRFVSINQACEKTWGYARQELMGNSIGLVLQTDEQQPGDDNAFARQILGAAKSIDKVSFESKLRCKSGKLLDVIWTGHWSASEGGLFCIVHDITAQKQIEQTIRDSEQRLRMTLESLPASVVVCDQSGNIEFSNNAAALLLKCQTAQLTGKPAARFFADDLHMEQLLGLADAGLNTSALSESGEAVPVEVWGRTIEMSGQAKNLLVFLDKTAQRELERVKREFLAMVTHDLRSPLTAVQGILSLMEHGVLGTVTERGAQMTQRANKECDRMLRLLNDMLEAEKIESGSFPIECSEIELDATISDAVDSVRQAAEAKQVALVTNLQQLQCWADYQRIIQVIINLLTNAVKYSPEKTTITISLENRDNFALVTVADQGRGIPADKQLKIFEKFEQVEAADAREKHGTGLGLAICKAIVEQHGGEIGVVSEGGSGSRFWFTVPRVAQTAARK